MGRLFLAAAAIAAMGMLTLISAGEAEAGSRLLLKALNPEVVVLAQNRRNRRGPRTRRLGPSGAPGGGQQWQAARAAQNCAPGGQILSSETSGNGYNFRVLMGSKVVDVQVDQNGNCR